jgi:aspartate-semialdehyde dehydrogenase
MTVEPAFAAAGCAVASNTSSYRMVDDVPLLIPECNYEHLDLIKVQREKRGWDGYLTTNPNCTTVMFTLPLKPLMKFGIQSVHVASMQAVS